MVLFSVQLKDSQSFLFTVIEQEESMCLSRGLRRCLQDKINFREKFKVIKSDILNSS